MIKTFYRISDKSYPKGKLPGASKAVCLHNFLESFNKDAITIIADNCSDNILTMCATTGCEITQTSLGNAGSFKFATERALELPDETIVYFCEDDYLHLRTASNYFTSEPANNLEEGLLVANYVTLYDHIDKYLCEYNDGEVTKVYRTLHSHWKHSISTTMTFATKVGTLREDMDIWRKHTSGTHPEDHLIFTALHEKGRTLGVQIPGTACHIDLTYSEKKWDFGGAMNRYCHLEPWVFPLIESIMAKEVFGNPDPRAFDPYVSGQKGLKRLMIISSLSNLQR